MSKLTAHVRDKDNIIRHSVKITPFPPHPRCAARHKKSCPATPRRTTSIKPPKAFNLIFRYEFECPSRNVNSQFIISGDFDIEFSKFISSFLFYVRNFRFTAIIVCHVDGP